MGGGGVASKDLVSTGDIGFTLLSTPPQALECGLRVIVVRKIGCNLSEVGWRVEVPLLVGKYFGCIR